MARRHFWFRPKSFGYGAVPVSWQGWLLTFSGASLIAGAIVVAILAEQQMWPHRRAWQAACVATAVLAPILLTAVARATTQGEWRWRP